MGAGGKFKITNPHTGAVETYDANPSYLTSAMEKATLDEDTANRVNQARAEIQRNTERGIQSGNAKDSGSQDAPE